MRLRSKDVAGLMLAATASLNSGVSHVVLGTAISCVLLYFPLFKETTTCFFSFTKMCKCVQWNVFALL